MRMQTQLETPLPTTPQTAYSSRPTASCSSESSSIILPNASLGLRCQPVEKGGAMSKRGKGCASVLRTIWSRGRRSSGEKRR